MFLLAVKSLNLYFPYQLISVTLSDVINVEFKDNFFFSYSPWLKNVFLLSLINFKRRAAIGKQNWKVGAIPIFVIIGQYLVISLRRVITLQPLLRKLMNWSNIHYFSLLVLNPLRIETREDRPHPEPSEHFSRALIGYYMSKFMLKHGNYYPFN